MNQDALQFRLKESGSYYVKARYLAYVAWENVPIELESESIKITITEPQGEDLEVWNLIKDNGDFAYFIQEGEIHIPSYRTEARTKFQAEVERIVTEHPNTVYAQSLRESLDKFKASEAKRQELMQKLQKQNP